jgi:conjugal transfer pilus assembly protein TraB
MRKLFKKMSPETRTWVIRGTILAALILIGYPLFIARTAQLPAHKQSFKILDNDAGTFEKALFAKSKADIDQLRAQIKELSEKLTAKQMQAPPVKAGAGDSDNLKARVEKQMAQMQQHQTPAPDVVRQQLFPEPVADKKATSVLPQKNFGIKTVKWEGGGKDQKQKNTIYLPPSFMDASLLTGVIAPATEVGKSHPIPMLIRIRDLAVLPNEVKQKDLKGCFVIAEGTGNLAQERVEARLLTLSCITRKGDAIIDQNVKGWVVDADGRAGLSGRVVAKFGTHIARVAIAGFIEGFGKAFEQTALDTNVNIVGGTTTTLKNNRPDTVLTAGAGRAVVEVAEDLKSFYLQLAQQTLPVVEVGPTKTITLILSEGVDLEIKDFKKNEG